MCNERDRLIAYIYNECDARERDAVQLHLDGCDECRTEVAGLRSVRSDLQAWDVPTHESVWRPFAPPPTPVWWRQVPAWGMAAAASLVLLSGAAGGAVVHAFMPEQTSVVARQDPAPSTPVSLTAADLAALEQRLSKSFSEQVGTLDARVRQVSNRPVSSSGVEGSRDALARQVVDLQAQNQDLKEVIRLINKNTEQIRTEFEIKNTALAQQVSQLRTLVVQLPQAPAK